MSPERVGLLTVTVNSSETPDELKRQLEREKSLRTILEEQVRQLENQLFQQQQTSVFDIEDPENLEMHLVAGESLPVGHTQTVVCSPPNSRSPSPVNVPPEQRLDHTTL